MLNLNPLKKSSPIDIGRSDFFEITKSYQTDNMKGKFPLFFEKRKIIVSKDFHVFLEGKISTMLEILCLTLKL